MSSPERKASNIRTICIVGHDRLSIALLNSLSEEFSHIHLLHSSSSEVDLPRNLRKSQVHVHHEPSTVFTDCDRLTALLSSFSPPADVLISTAHGGDYSLQTTIISACIRAGIPRFMPAEFHHDSLNPIIQKLLPPHAERARVVGFLQKQAENERLQWVGLATGINLSKRLVDGNMGVDLAWQSATVIGTGAELFAASSDDFICRVVAAILDHWDKLRDQYLCISGLVTDYNQLLDALGHEMGCKFEVGLVDIDESTHEATRRIEGGWPDAGMFLLERTALASEICFEGFRRDQAIAKMLDLEFDSLQTIIHNAVHQFKHHGKGGCGCV